MFGFPPAPVFYFMTNRSGRLRMTRGNNIKPTTIARLANKRSVGSNRINVGRTTILPIAVATSILEYFAIVFVIFAFN